MTPIFTRHAAGRSRNVVNSYLQYGYNLLGGLPRFFTIKWIFLHSFLSQDGLSQTYEKESAISGSTSKRVTGGETRPNETGIQVPGLQHSQNKNSCNS